MACSLWGTCEFIEKQFAYNLYQLMTVKIAETNTNTTLNKRRLILSEYF